MSFGKQDPPNPGPAFKKSDPILIEDSYVPNLEIFFDNFENIKNIEHEDNFNEINNPQIFFDEDNTYNENKNSVNNNIKLENYNFTKLKLNDISLDDLKSFRDDTFILNKNTIDKNKSRSNLLIEKDKFVSKKTLK